jgi:hypothetical protein
MVYGSWCSVLCYGSSSASRHPSLVQLLSASSLVFRSETREGAREGQHNESLMKALSKEVPFSISWERTVGSYCAES